MVIGRALAKDPGKRYPTCTEFVNALEAALKTKKNWKALAHGASGSMPTVVVGSGVLDARPRAYAESAAAAPARGKSRLLLRVLAGLLAGIGLVALLFVAAQKYILDQRPPGEELPAISSKPPEQNAAKPATAAKAKPSPAPTAPAATAQVRPPTENRVETPKPPRPKVEAPAAELPLQVTTSPPGAGAVLDDDAAKTCKSPCSFQVSRGRHTLAVTLAGYRRELRILDVTSPREVFVSLTQANGTLRITSEPAGAQIVINGQARTQTTPANFVLPAGRYSVQVSKDGRQIQQTVDIKDGALASLDMQLP
jgi:hypothetical protein